MKKKKTIILMTILTLFVGINSVKASSFYKDQKFSRGTLNNKGVQDFTLSGFMTVDGTNQKADLKDSLYRYTDGTSTSVAYCIDPAFSNPVDVKVKRILKNNDVNKKSDAYDYGMYTIVSEGFGNKKNSYTFSYDGQSYNISGTDFEIATMIAVRAFDSGIFGYDQTTKNNKNAKWNLPQVHAYTKLGIKWGSEFGTVTSTAINKCGQANGNANELSKCLTTIAEARHGKLSNLTITPGTKGDRLWLIYYAARSLVEKAVNAAANYRNDTSSAPSVDVQQLGATKESSKNNGVLDTEVRVINFTIKNFSSKGYVNNIQVSCPECAAQGISITNIEYYNISQSRWMPLNTNVNLANNVDKTSIAKIRFKSTRTNATNQTCKSVNYNVTFNEWDPSLPDAAAVLNAQSKAAENSLQRVIMLNDNTETSRTFSGTINCFKTTCPTTIGVPDCDGDANADVIAPSDIVSCILDNTDDAGNTYQLTSENGGVSNAYCNVFCKEDYRDVFTDNKYKKGITLTPEIKDKWCGGYFKLEAHIEGQKDCYTGGTASDHSINHQQFINDLNEAIREMIAAYNAAQKMKAALENIDNAINHVEGKKWWDTTASYVEYYETCTTTKDKDGKDVETCSCNWRRSCQSYAVSGGASGAAEGEADANGIITIRTTTIPYVYGGNGYDGGQSGTGCGNPDCKAGDPEVLRQAIIDEAFTNKWVAGTIGNKNVASTPGYWAKVDVDAILNAAIKRIEVIIDTYNSCTDGWDMEFPFAPTIGFDYQERYYSNLLNKVPEKKYLTRVDSTLQESGTEEEYCYGTINDDYTCNGRKSNEIETTQYTINICSSDGCNSSLTKDVSTVKYVKKSIKKGVDYITPSVFYQVYPSGRITIKEDYYGNELQLKLLENRLPIASGTVGGGNFWLKIQDLGEFYNTGELGRLMDFEGDNQNNSVAQILTEKQTNSSEKTFNGNYVCNYNVKCRDSGCPDCTFSCVGENCEFTKCPDCDVYCINCLFDLNKLQLNMKTVSNNNFFSAGRDYGYNWTILDKIDKNWDLYTKFELIASKADATVKEIEEKNDTVYSEEDLAFSIKLTPQLTRQIREYNKSAEEAGGYANDSLTCYNAGENGEYANVFCYSDFLDELIANDRDDLIRMPDKRLASKEERERSKDQNGYWTTWNNYVYKESVIGGPSWK